MLSPFIHHTKENTTNRGVPLRFNTVEPKHVTWGLGLINANKPLITTSKRPIQTPPCNQPPTQQTENEGASQLMSYYQQLHLLPCLIGISNPPPSGYARKGRTRKNREIMEIVLL